MFNWLLTLRAYCIGGGGCAGAQSWHASQCLPDHPCTHVALLRRLIWSTGGTGWVRAVMTALLPPAQMRGDLWACLSQAPYRWVLLPGQAPGDWCV
jgi:hypothetical protein